MFDRYDPRADASESGAARKAGLTQDGVHILRHSFCSHPAMRGAPARAVQELAGHADLTMTHRCM